MVVDEPDTALADRETAPTVAILAVLAEELAGLIARMAAEPDFAQARTLTRRFAELIRSTPSLRAYQYEQIERLTAPTTELLAARADADASEALAAAHALLGLWPVQYASLRRRLETAPSPEALAADVTADVHRAARLIEHGLAGWSCS